MVQDSLFENGELQPAKARPKRLKVIKAKTAADRFKAATAKADRARAPSTAAAAAAPKEAGSDGTAARQLSVRQDEYVDGLDCAADPPTDEPDVLGLRRKKKPSLGARARSLALARRWLVPGLRTDAVPP